MPPTRRVVVAHCAVFGVCREDLVGPLGGTVIFAGAMAGFGDREDRCVGSRSSKKDCDYIQLCWMRPVTQ